MSDSPSDTSRLGLDYLPIADHGVIGNLETVALVGINGSIDFMCFPNFDSPSVFASLLDKNKGGFFQIRPTETDFSCRQMYLPDTNILLTRFLGADGILEVIDFMPIAKDFSRQQLIRIVKSVHGDLEVSVCCQPHFEYASAKTKAKKIAGDRIKFSAAGSDATDAVLHAIGEDLAVDNNAAVANFCLQENERVCFRYLCDACDVEDDIESLEIIDKMLERTTAFWRDWVNQSTYDGIWRENVKRSALVLKLLISDRHGSMVAAPTFSLPEVIGGARNWDYRYCWIRDSAFTVYALLKLGFYSEATHFIDWIAQRYNESSSEGELQLMYALDGSHDIDEEELSQLEGYKQSQPVRIGNEAKNQLQLDIYGELIDSIYIAHKYSTPMSYTGWKNLSLSIEYVADNWHKPDEGIWEVRGGKKHFLHSRLMCWVAMDRGIRLSKKASLPAPLQRWQKIRDEIYCEIQEEFWNEELEAFVQFKGSDKADASTLLMPLVKFISPIDPRWTSTLAFIEEQLVTDAFVKRYIPDAEVEGIEGHEEEGSFTICSFWYCENLARAGRAAEARLFFEKLMGYANHLGLFSEELGFQAEHLGNFPQAFTHLSLISAATAIERALDNGGQPF